MIFLLYCWGSLFGVPMDVTLHMELELSIEFCVTSYTKILENSEGPSTQYSRILVPNTVPLMVFGTRYLNPVGNLAVSYVQGHAGFHSSTMRCVECLLPTVRCRVASFHPTVDAGLT